jgi:hypothetical protein
MSNSNVYASYNGSQLGFTIRNLGLDQLSYTNIGKEINSIAAGANNDLYVAAGNQLLHYAQDGTLLKDMTFPDTGINYTSLTVKSDRLYAAYNGSQVGFTVRDLNLNQLAYVPTSFVSSGIAAGSNNDLFLTSSNHIYHMKSDGTLIQDMAFPISSINYTDVSVLGDRVLASYNGSQQGFTVRDLNLQQLTCTNTGFDINAIAAGPSDNVYLASANHLYNYDQNGTQIEDMTFPLNSINYTGVSLVFVSLT